jgi:hypothetical protein
MSGIASLIERELAAADLLLPEEKLARLQREAMAIGRSALPRALASARASAADTGATPAAALGLAEAVLPRIFGLGWQQAHGLAAIAGVRKREQSDVALLGGMLNLGVALFDHVCDRLPQQAGLLLERVTPEFLDAQLAGRGAATPPSGDPGVDVLLALIADFFAGARRLRGSGADVREFTEMIGAMYDAERFTILNGRHASAPTPEVWEELRRKSALPMQATAMLALLAVEDTDAGRRDSVRLAATLAGESIWIVDDLADVVEDWDADCWSRALWLLANAHGEAPRDGADAVRLLVRTGVAALEAQRLAERLGELRRVPGAPERAFLRPLQGAIASWIELLPD